MRGGSPERASPGSPGDPARTARDFVRAFAVVGRPPRKNAPLVKLLLERGADPGAQLHEAAVESNPEVLELLVAHGAEVDLRRDGSTPLHYLIGHRMPANARWFLERGANPNAKARDGTTPLHLAAAVGVRQEVLEVLVGHGARPTIKDRRGRTALEAAREAGNKRAVVYLRSL